MGSRAQNAGAAPNLLIRPEQPIDADATLTKAAFVAMEAKGFPGNPTTEITVPKGLEPE